MTPSGTGQQRTITAFFDNREDANEAVQRLHSEGFSRESVRLVEGSERSRTGTTAEGDVNPDNFRDTYNANEGFGFWESLKDLFLPDEDRSTYAEGLRRGGYLVTVTTRDANYDRALDILDDEGTIDIDERASSWRSEGWTGYSDPDRSRSSTVGSTAATAGMTAAAGSAGMTTPSGLGAAGTPGTAGRPGMTTPSTGTAARGASDREETIPIVEEKLNIGKREVSGGRVKVRSYVVETPVHEDVSLRQEHVSIERRPVDRPIGDKDKLFEDRTIGATEKREEAVISKDARVKEELVVKKDVDQRTEKVSDTVRRTEVEVDDERDSRLSGTTGSTTDRTRR